MGSTKLDGIPALTRLLASGAACLTALAMWSSAALGDSVKDLKYGAVLYEFYQQKYFETLVEYDYALERGGIQNHGDYPELLKGGVSLSYGLDLQAKDIFSRLIAEHSPEEVQNRAWFYLAKMLYLRGDVERSARTLANIRGALPNEIDPEYRYLGALVNIKLGYLNEAEQISQSFKRTTPYAPYLHFNLGVALGKKREYERAIANLTKAASFADGTPELEGLADRAHMAIAYLFADKQDYDNAHLEIKNVRTSGVYSNRALLGAGWASVNSGSYRQALAPLSTLKSRSIAIPEVQEAVLLVPHVYEKLGLRGRAAAGFISAYDLYGDALAQLDKAREGLKEADVLELFVQNLDEVLGESDWYGTAPSVSLNALSPFLLDLMSDHSFQSVLKDLRDLYAIRNNLNGWKRKRDDFEVMIEARAESTDAAGRKQALVNYSQQHDEHGARYRELVRRVATLGEDDRKRVAWLLEDMEHELSAASTMVEELLNASGVSTNTDSYERRVVSNMKALEVELEKTNNMIAKVEDVLLQLVRAELDLHEQRLKYYRVQSHLAKARILDKSLSDADAANVEKGIDAQTEQEAPEPSEGRKAATQGDDNAA